MIKKCEWLASSTAEEGWGTELDEEQWNVDHASLEATLNMLQKDKQNAHKQTLSSRSRLCVYLGYALVTVPVTIWNAVKLGLYQKQQHLHPT